MCFTIDSSINHKVIYVFLNRMDIKNDGKYLDTDSDDTESYDKYEENWAEEEKN